MPHNRVAAFWDIIRLRYDVSLKLGGLFLLFALPIILSLFIGRYWTSNLYQALEDGMEEAEYRQTLFIVLLIRNGVISFSLLLMTFPIAGSLRLFRQLAFYEGIWFSKDYLRGIKENGKEVFLELLIVSILHLLSSSLIAYSYAFGSNEFWTTILFFLPGFLGITFLLPPVFLMFAQNPIYSNRFSQTFANGYVFYGKYAFQTLGMTLGVIGPLFLLLIPNVYSILAVCVLYFFLWLPLSGLAFFLFSCFVFDKILNVNQFPELVDRGVWRR